MFQLGFVLVSFFAVLTAWLCRNLVKVLNRVALVSIVSLLASYLLYWLPPILRNYDRYNGELETWAWFFIIFWSVFATAIGFIALFLFSKKAKNLFIEQ